MLKGARTGEIWAVANRGFQCHVPLASGSAAPELLVLPVFPARDFSCINVNALQMCEKKIRQKTGILQDVSGESGKRSQLGYGSFLLVLAT